ncbi:hypothetical protein H5V45_16165 [Nocardioides sp. KIGAM211]|uniref:RNA polymerase sigma factor 70 region 4 type 2 domain-containing protein n=1 Tax=Nocardioides luti TaxID=2761101 RepID=A0A7X0RKP0_9ACTN|nr:hypothetical protein [Nocardioides luti]MBB6628864.1 hypothetical protein [Nocardioides luti]
MRNPDEFDAFYKDARDRLLLQTYALTGDLPASRAAVRDSFVVAWHHWRKISRQEDPETWARPHAWAHAQRRHTARLWHREKKLDPEARATLDALGKLSTPQRKALLLTHLTTVPLSDMAREVGLPRTEVERELQTATAQFAVHRDVPSTSIRPLFEALRDHVASVTWPRATIIRRAGAARRRTHTGVGAVVTVAALVLTGALVTDAAGVHPTLDRERLTTSAPKGPDATSSPEAEPEVLPASTMLEDADLRRTAPGRDWQVRRTTKNVGKKRVEVPCTRERYADPQGLAALVRTFRAAPAKGAPRRTALQATEASRTEAAARRTFATTRAWFAGCSDERVQLLATREVPGVGDDAVQLVLRSWQAPVTTMVVGLARTGVFTTTTVESLASTTVPDSRLSAAVLGAAVDRLCPTSGAGACADDKPRVRDRAPFPADEYPAGLGLVDLPPITGVDKPWVATPPQQARTNVAATSCDGTAFTGRAYGAPISHASTRSYLILKAGLPDEFGLTETQGSLPVKAAKAFVAGVRTKLAACPDKELGTDVRRTTELTSADRQLTVWHLTTELSDNKKLTVAMAIMRVGTGVAQLGFVPAPGAPMSDAAFEALARRALERLERQASPSR